jgi:hypothetical protein
LNTAPSGGFAYFVCTAYNRSTKRACQQTSSKTASLLFAAFLICPSFLGHVNHVSNLKNGVTFSDLRSSPLHCDYIITVKYKNL